MRAREPDNSGYIVRDGVNVYYEEFGDGDPTVLLMPTHPIVHSLMWKAQVPYLARHFRVVTFDPRGNGKSDRPTNPAAYDDSNYVSDALQVMDETATERAVLVGLCSGVHWCLQLGAAHPDRVLGVVSLAAGVPFLAPPHPHRLEYSFDEELDTDEGWAKDNRHFWKRDYRAFVEFFFEQLLPEPHSTKQWEDCVEWAMESSVEAMLAADEGKVTPASEEEAAELLRRLTFPTLFIHGRLDACQPFDRSARAAELTGGTLVTLEGVGHVPQARHPVKINSLIRSFVQSIVPPRRLQVEWTRSTKRPRRALFVSSPIGLGHTLRDIAIADELRKKEPEIEIHWLTQNPVTKVLHERGETIHPAARHLASESGHFQSECAEHDLHAFQSIRTMDEILVNNFMVFKDLVEEEHYDLWVADEGWDVDYFLHENPELKRAPFAWLTDFVGWVPMPSGGDREAVVAADYNLEMIEHIERHPHLRDRSVYVGDPDDIVPLDFGPDLPSIRDWTQEHFAFPGYVTGFDPNDYADRDELRARLGFEPDERVCIATVGGSGVGEALLRRVIAAFPLAKRLVPALRLIVVAGPRIDPGSLEAPDGLEVRGYVQGLYQYLAASDLAIVHGGLTTTMELTASKRPFIYVPLRDHFEQNFHVRHRLNRYGAGRHMEYDDATPEAIAHAVDEEIAREVDYRDVDSDGAARAAALLAELL
ncbi:MAG: alpha/beta fold hydrolase [Actinobacteria bacterium]|nr:alpha/beta fold hydrolase [Actinomycetota bacterium]